MRGEHQVDGQALVQRLRGWARELGFSQIGIADVDLHSAEEGLRDWLAAGFHGGMGYMAAHGLRRARPAALVPGTVRVISARMDYLPRDAGAGWVVAETAALREPGRAVVSIYARGRDYHKVLRARLQRLADLMVAELGPFPYRAFTDSAPVMEVALAARAGLGWQGKHTLLLSREAGSYYFLGELFVGLDLAKDAPVSGHCGTCERCLDACPTRAIVAPYQLDARRCISYLTIENPGPIPEEFRAAIGNRIYGCDDCQLACPWNKYAHLAAAPDFATRNNLDAAALVDLFAWTREEFESRLEGSAIRRIGHARWLRNIAVALGNAPTTNDVVDALRSRADHADPMVREHVQWALDRHG